MGAILNPMKQRLQAWGDSKVIEIVGAFVFNDDGEVLLLQRHTDDLGGGQWGTPGGRIEPGESAPEAMHRELREETGLSGLALQELGAHMIRMPHGTVRMTSYLGSLPCRVEVVLDPEEHHAWQWFKVDGLVGDPSILYGIPTILRDYKLLSFEGDDPTLVDGSSTELVT